MTAYSWIEQRKSNGAHSTLQMLQSYVLSYVLRNKSLEKKNGMYTYEYEFCSSKKCTWLQYEKPQKIQAPGTTFSNFGDEVWMEGGHGNCCRFATLTGVHQGAHISLAKYWIKGKVRS